MKHVAFGLLLFAACSGGHSGVRYDGPVMRVRWDSAALDTWQDTPPPVDPDQMVIFERSVAFSGWTLVPAAEFNRGNRRVVIMWPALGPNGWTVDGELVGITLERGEDGGYEPSRDKWDVTGSNTTYTELGGQDARLRPRREGVPQETLGPRFAALLSAFRSSVRSHNRAVARRTALDFFRLGNLEWSVFNENGSKLLAASIGEQFAVEFVSAETTGNRMSIKVRLATDGEPVEHTYIAAPSTSAPDKWVIFEEARTP